MLTGKSTCCALRPPDTLLLTVTKTRLGNKEHENELVQIERNCKENLSNALQCKNSPQCGQRQLIVQKVNLSNQESEKNSL